MDSANLDRFTPEAEEAERRISAKDSVVDSGNQMLVSSLSGEYYRNLDLAVTPGSNVVIIGDNAAACRELITDLARAKDASMSTKIQLPNDARLEFVTPSATEAIQNTDITLKEFFLEARGIAGVEEELTAIWGDVDKQPGLLAKAGRLQEKFEAAGGWSVGTEIETLIEGLRIVDNPHDKISLETKLDEMSSGQISKALIGRALFSEAGIVVMDDPSVHLDVQSKRWLAEYMNASRQAIVISTTDMEFANKVANRVVEILDSHLVLNIGLDVDSYMEERGRLIKSWTNKAKKKQEDIVKLEVHIRDFLAPAARKTDNMAQVLRANRTKLERMKTEYQNMPGRILLESQRNHTVEKAFKEKVRSGNKVLEIDDLLISYISATENQESTIEIPKLTLHRGDKLAVIGKNGSGKSTLLRVVAGDTSEMELTNQVKLGASITLGYYSPYTKLYEQDRPLRQQLGDHARDAMSIMRYWGFTRKGDYDVKPKDLIHRDEQARAQLAHLMALQPNFLLLDEPTSYLMPSYQEKLVKALKKYDGTLLVVSHDPHFLAKLGLSGRVSMPGGEREDF